MAGQTTQEPNENHAAKFRYATSQKSIAAVNSGGVIKSRKKGACQIYVYAVNGVSKKITVNVG